MTLIETVMTAEPFVDMSWNRVHFLRSVGLDAQILTANPFESSVVDRYEAGDLDGTEPPDLYGIKAPGGYRLLTNGPAEDGELIWAIYVRPITRLGQRLLEEITLEECAEKAIEMAGVSSAGKEGLSHE